MPDYILKLKALLHDPVHKIWSFINVDDKIINHKELLSQKQKWHEKVAQDIFCFLFDEDLNDKIVKKADIIDSNLSRIVISSNIDKEKTDSNKDDSEIFKEAKYIDFLSGNECEIGNPKDNKEVIDIFKKLGELNFSSQEEKAKYYFLFLWRFLPEIFPWMNNHPADSRAPNHSIYDHLVQSAAIAACLENNDYPAFLLFTLGPVQDFIAKAKKTSDLWAGSFLISYLTFTALEVIMEELGPDHIVFPNLIGQPLADRWLYRKIKDKELDIECFTNWKKQWEKQLDKESKEKPFDDVLTIANIPNRFLAILPKSRVKEIADKCKIKIKEKLNNFIDQLKIKEKEQVKEQVESFFNFYYVILPWQDRKDSIDNIDTIIENYKTLIDDNDKVKLIQLIKDNSNYKSRSIGIAYSLLVELTERFLSARKNIRDFINIKPQEGKKCKICGEYTAIVNDYEDELCGVCYLKRKLPDIMKEELQLKEAVRYPSTSELPTIKYKLEIPDNVAVELKHKIGSIGEILTKKFISVPKLKGNTLYNIDGQFLMQGTYRMEILKREYNIDLDANKISEMKNYLKNKKISPPVYYAILSMDGDEMGKWLNGEKMLAIKELIHPKIREALIELYNKKRELKTILEYHHPMIPSFHNGFSRRLSNFALNDVKKIVESKYYGKLIYAGGDDVLAFLPVEDALACACDLQQTFKDTLCDRASMSAGIVFVHHKYPLQIALNEVREAERKAKNKYGRNACCIKLLKNSGGSRMTGFHWDKDTEKININGISTENFFNNIIHLYKEDRISSKFGYDFMHIVDEIGEQKEENVRKILQRELKRIYLHKTPAEKQDHQFLDDMLNIFDSWEYDYRDFANIFIIGRFVSQNGWE